MLASNNDLLIRSSSARLLQSMAQLSGLLVIEKVNISQQQGIDRFKGQAGHLQTGYSLSVFIGQIMLLGSQQ